MNCETAREQLMELDVSRFGQLAHLETCSQCQASSERIRVAEKVIGEYVDAYLDARDFESEWSDAQAEALETEEVARPKRWPWVVLVLTLLVMLGSSAVAAVVLVLHFL